jgi:LysR family transcriptional regulator, low CO2-responsive transcriptional regulator
MRGLTLKQLRIVAAVGRTGKITGAAKELNVTPPAVTLQLKLVEDGVGLALFERTKGGMRPTEAGLQVIETAAHIETALAECVEALKAMRGLGRGRVVVGLVSTAKYVVPRALAAFAKTHPGIELRLLVGNRAQTLAALERLELDFAITGYPPEDMAVERQVIGNHPHVIIAAVDHRLVSRRRLKLADLADETFVVRERGSGTRLLMERLFANATLRPRIAMEVDSNETIKQAVIAGLGVAFLSAHTIAAEVETGRLAVLPVAGLPAIRRWYAVKHKEKRLLPAAEAMWHFLVSEGARFLPGVEARAGAAPARAKLTIVPFEQ